jgi:hypothetical protein
VGAGGTGEGRATLPNLYDPQIWQPGFPKFGPGALAAFFESVAGVWQEARSPAPQPNGRIAAAEAASRARRSRMESRPKPSPPRLSSAKHRPPGGWAGLTLRVLLDTLARCCPHLHTSACAVGGILRNWRQWMRNDFKPAAACSVEVL